MGYDRHEPHELTLRDEVRHESPHAVWLHLDEMSTETTDMAAGAWGGEKRTATASWAQGFLSGCWKHFRSGGCTTLNVPNATELFTSLVLRYTHFNSTKTKPKTNLQLQDKSDSTSPATPLVHLPVVAGLACLIGHFKSATGQVVWDSPQWNCVKIKITVPWMRAGEVLGHGVCEELSFITQQLYTGFHCPLYNENHIIYFYFN